MNVNEQQYHHLNNIISNCNSALETKCIYCKRNKTCKEYNLFIKLEEERKKENETQL